jgi:hypothetical protein
MYAGKEEVKVSLVWCVKCHWSMNDAAPCGVKPQKSSRGLFTFYIHSIIIWFTDVWWVWNYLRFHYIFHLHNSHWYEIQPGMAEAICTGCATLYSRFEVHLFINTVKSRAVDRSTIRFLTIFGVLLTKTCYYPRRATVAMSCNECIKGFMNSFQSL